jgi:hypothetical protein
MLANNFAPVMVETEMLETMAGAIGTLAGAIGKTSQACSANDRLKHLNHDRGKVVCKHATNSSSRQFA